MMHGCITETYATHSIVLYHIMLHIVALLENEIMEEWQSDFMPWFPISQLLSSEKTQDANFPDGVGKWRFHRFPRMSALKLLEIHKVISLLKGRIRVMSKRNFRNVIFTTVQYRPWNFYMKWFIYTESHTQIFSVNSCELGSQRGIWKPKID